VNLKKLVAEEPKPLQKSLGQLVFNYVGVLYIERTLSNAKELWIMYSLHALNHVLKYVPIQVLDHLHTNQNSGPRPSSKKQCPPSKHYWRGNRVLILRLHKA